MIKLNDSVSVIPFIGTSYVEKLSKLEIVTIKDLLFYFPVRYEDNSIIYKIKDLSKTEPHTIIAEVVSASSIRIRNRKKITKALLSDGEDTIEAIWFNQEYIERELKQGVEYYMNGKLYITKGKAYLSSPKFELYREDAIHTKGLVPVYSLTSGISAKWIRSRLNYLVKLIKSGDLILKESLTKDVLKSQDLLEINKAITEIHFPSSEINLNHARSRFAFEEMYNFLLIAKKVRDKESRYKAPELKAENTKLNTFIKNLPFELTDSQIRVLAETLSDIRSDKPMMKLMQGDTGSGKTVIAAALSLVSSENDKKAVILAPTTVLAKQHFLTLKSFYKGLNIKVGLITSAEKININADILVGTHAILAHKNVIKNLGLLIVDEQHRFGVKQRNDLLGLEISKGIKPHYLNMTATPIPRSLALVLWSEFDITYLRDMPKGRQITESHIVPKNKRIDANTWIKKEVLDQGNQLFIICPLIDDNEVLEIKSATSEYELINNKIFKGYKSELVHGRIKNKTKLLEDFKDKKYQILVSTSVIEVGIDIPDATCIIIEGAERFGLAQLHQLRGRVGRSDKKSYCLLFVSDNFNPNNDLALRRLEFFSNNNDGLKLAEFDLKSRGPGEVYGTRQSGIPEFQIASMYDKELIEKVRGEISKLK